MATQYNILIEFHAFELTPHIFSASARVFGNTLFTVSGSINDVLPAINNATHKIPIGKIGETYSDCIKKNITFKTKKLNENLSYQNHQEWCRYTTNSSPKTTRSKR